MVSPHCKLSHFQVTLLYIRTVLFPSLLQKISDVMQNGFCLGSTKSLHPPLVTDDDDDDDEGDCVSSQQHPTTWALVIDM